jgi:hypothetical protein
VTWDDALRDLEASAAGDERLAVDASASAIADAELARTPLVQRWEAGRGRRVQVRLIGGHVLSGTVARGGPELLLLAGPATVLPVACVIAIAGSLIREVGQGTGPLPADDDVAEVSGLRLTAALRTWSRHRRLVAVGTIDGVVRRGTLVGVGLDHLDLLQHEWSTPLAEATARAELISLSAVAFARGEL